jgi:hypothetical protein
MFGGLTDMPRISSYEQALALFERVQPIKGKSVNAGIKPLCNTATGRRKTQYSIRKKKHPAAASKQAIECVLYMTPVVTFVEDGTIYIDMSYPSKTTHAFVSEILNDFRAYCSYRDSKTWLHCRGKDWWIPNGHGVTFKVVGDGIEPVRPRLMDRYVVNRSKAKEVYARYAAFISHCVTISKVTDPQQMRGYVVSEPSTDFSMLQTAEPNDEWVQRGFYSIGQAVVSNYEWENHNIRTVYSLDPKEVRQVILDKLKREHYQEIFEVVKAEVGVYTKCLNEEYIR